MAHRVAGGPAEAVGPHTLAGAGTENPEGPENKLSLNKLRFLAYSKINMTVIFLKFT